MQQTQLLLSAWAFALLVVLPTPDGLSRAHPIVGAV